MAEEPTERLSVLRRLPTAVVAILGVAVAVGIPTGGYYAFRTYDYVQHDNDFCLGCHLMVEPFERFARSEHRGLGCKACHQPTLMTRSQMALTQVIQNPDQLETHAEVPNAVCEACHIEGDPEKWTRIANSAGHRVHFESDDPSLEGLSCVECHSTSLHEFSASDRTCGQSDCHSNTEIQLGRMGDFTIHCAACHGFSAVVPPTESPEVLAAALRPDAAECLSCHAMREAAQMPADDPHQGVCASCHNPHTQAVAAEAVESCATAGCHTDVEELTDFHRGLAPTALESCLNCHAAHDFHVDGANCTACHADIMLPPPGAGPGQGAMPAGLSAPERGASSPFLHRTASMVTAVATGTASTAASPTAAHPTPATQQALDLASDSVVFRHFTHATVDCLSCHATDGSHGRITVTSARECRSCHHTEPLVGDCAACHTAGDAFRERAYTLTRTLELTVRDDVTRPLPFDHSIHLEADCATCHVGSIDLVASDVDCTSCHEDHHQPEARCASCHTPAPLSAHPVDQVHLGCTGAGCHTPPPFAPTIERTRNFCVTCHQDMEVHRVGEGTCIECHAVGPMGGSEA